MYKGIKVRIHTPCQKLCKPENNKMISTKRKTIVNLEFYIQQKTSEMRVK